MYAMSRNANKKGSLFVSSEHGMFQATRLMAAFTEMRKPVLLRNLVVSSSSYYLYDLLSRSSIL